MNRGEALDWAICGAGLRSDDRAMRDALAAQDYLYTLYEPGRPAGHRVRVIGAISGMLLAEDGAEALLEKLAEPAIRIVSLTITEGGYCIDDGSGEFLAELPLVRHDLANPRTPRGSSAFSARLCGGADTGVPAFTVMSCDNLPHNGEVARKALLAFAERLDPGLARWIATHVSFPNAMVDRITPMTSPAHRRQLAQRHGVEDAWPVVCEPFVQWVLEDRFSAGRPAWEKVGVQFTDDVTPYEEMKIGLLNGSHLALTYLGFLRGYRFVHETLGDPLLRRYVRTFMDRDVAPLLAPVPGIDLERYKDSLVERFANRAIADQLERVCSDGSSKFPKFIVPTANRLIAAGRPLERVALVVAAWALYLGGVDEHGEHYPIPDPRAAECQALVAERHGLGRRLLGVETVFGPAIRPRRPSSRPSSASTTACADTASAKPCARYSANDSGGPHARIVPRHRLRHPRQQGAAARRRQRLHAGPGQRRAAPAGRPRRTPRAGPGGLAGSHGQRGTHGPGRSRGGRPRGPRPGGFRPAAWAAPARRRGPGAAPGQALVRHRARRRTASLLEALGGPAGSLERLGLVLAPGYTLSKLLWSRRRFPELFARVAHILLPHDYLNHWLTGRVCSEAGDASGSGYFDVRRRTWASDVLERSSRADAWRRRCRSDRARRLHRQPAPRSGRRPRPGSPTRVAGGGGDNMLAAIGTGNIRPGLLTASLGTSGTLAAYAERPLVSPHGGWRPSAPRPAAGCRWPAR